MTSLLSLIATTWLGRSDRLIFEVASSEGCAVVTNNIKDFRPLAAEWLAHG